MSRATTLSPGLWGLDRPWQSHAPASLLLRQPRSETQDPQIQHSSLQLICILSPLQALIHANAEDTAANKTEALPSWSSCSI